MNKMTTPIHGIIFDIGNTLMYLDGDMRDTAQQGAAEMAHFLVSKGLTLDPEIVSAAFLSRREADFRQAALDGDEKPCAKSLQQVLAEMQVPEKFLRLIPEAVRISFRTEEERWTAFPASRSVLKQLHSNYRIGILSNATDDGLIQRLVNRLEFRPWVAPVFTSAYLGARKPRPEPFLAVLEAWNLAPQEAVMVGDRLDADIVGGRDLGMRTVLITADEPEDNDLLRHSVIPDGVIADIEELPALLHSWQT
jgi:FMN phosphatase YigB (HAD superfamily)